MDLAPLLIRNDSKIVLVVVDGLGGMADGEHSTELEEASTPHLDRLASEGVTGLLDPVGPGITPGSGPGHLALFGYDPIQHELGRGALSAAGLGFDLRSGDVAARANLCTLDAEGNVTDRRAGRPSDDEGRRIVERLQSDVHVPDAEVFFKHERQHRVLVVVRGDGLDPRVTDTDPQATGVPPLEPRAKDPAARTMADIATRLQEEARRVLADETSANGLLLRGFDSRRDLPDFGERYGLRPAAVAVYPMYRGIAHLLGMDVLGPPDDLAEQVDLLRKNWEPLDFFF